MVGSEISLPAMEFALVAVKTLNKEELMQLKVLNNTVWKAFERWKLINVAGLLCLGLPDHDCVFGLIYSGDDCELLSYSEQSEESDCSVCVTGDG